MVMVEIPPDTVAVAVAVTPPAPVGGAIVKVGVVLYSPPPAAAIVIPLILLDIVAVAVAVTPSAPVGAVKVTLGTAV